MITVRSLRVYPVKSCRGIDLETAEVVATGFRYDREWMVVGEDGSFLSQRRHPVLATVVTGIDRGCLTLSAPSFPDLEVSLDGAGGTPRLVTVWGDSCDARSEGSEAADWFSTLLGERCHLVRLPSDSARRVDPRFAAPGDRVAFADGFPFLLLGQASIDELNRRLEQPVPADRFRSNIVVDGAPAHDEDRWRSITAGDVVFDVVKPCARCVVVTTDQATGDRSPEPLKTLASYRSVAGKVLFGQNLVHRGRGTVRRGDEVEVLDRR